MAKVESHLLNSLVSHLKRKAELEANKQAIDEELNQLNGFIDTFKKGNKELFKKATEVYSQKQKIGTWGDRVNLVLKALKKPVVFGDIVDKVIELKLDGGLSKRDVQRRLNSQLFLMEQYGKVVKTPSDDGNKYSLTK